MIATRETIFSNLFNGLLLDEGTETSLYKPTPWQHYGSTREFCQSEFMGVEFTPEILDMFDSLDNNVETYVQSANSTGKTHGIAHAAIACYKRFPGAKVFTLAAPPEDNLRLQIWAEIGRIIDNFPLLFAGDTISTASMRIKRSSYEFIEAVTIPATGTPEQRQARASGKHAPYLFFFVDEADAVPPEIYRGIESCMSGSYVRLICTFNPRAKAGPVYNKQQAGEGITKKLSALTHPNVLTGKDLFPGAIDRNTTVRRINEWSRPLAPGEKPDFECFEVPHHLVGAIAISREGIAYPPLPAGKRKVTVPELWHMTLGDYPTQAENQLISSAWIDDAVSRFHMYVATYGEVPPVGVRPIVGQDVGEFGPDDSVFCARFGGYVPWPKFWNGVDPMETADKCYNNAIEIGAYQINVDATGIGSGVVPAIERLGFKKVMRVMAGSKPDPELHRTELGAFYNMRALLAWELRTWLSKPEYGAMLPPHQRLRDELLAPKYWKEKNEIRVTEKKVLRELANGKSCDYFDALCLTFYKETMQKTSKLTQQNYAYGDTGKSARLDNRSARITISKGSF